MLAEQRRAKILEILGETGSVSVTDLHRRLKVSRETIRRDITRLDQENRLRKTHGGALSFDGIEPTFEERMGVNLDGKRRIGREAAELVPDGASMMIDYGTTTLCLAEALAKTYAAEVTKTAIRVNLIDPGPIRTRLRESAYPGESATALKAPDAAAAAFVELADPSCARHGELVIL